MVALALDDIPMMNGYSGFFPASHFRLQKLIETQGLSRETLQMLYAAKVQFVVARANSLPQITPQKTGDLMLNTVFSDSAGMEVLELQSQ